MICRSELESLQIIVCCHCEPWLHSAPPGAAVLHVSYTYDLSDWLLPLKGKRYRSWSLLCVIFIEFFFPQFFSCKPRVFSSCQYQFFNVFLMLCILNMMELSKWETRRSFNTGRWHILTSGFLFCFVWGFVCFWCL